MKRIPVTPDSPEWAEERRHGFGASEAAAACGVSRWSTPAEVYWIKRGEMLPFQGNEAMEMGHLLEPVVADIWNRRNEDLPVETLQPGMFRHDHLDFVRATPDATLIKAEHGLEIKTCGERTGASLGDEYSDNLPVEWVLQAQQQMVVMDWEVVHFAVLVGGQRYRQFAVRRDDELIGSVLDAETELWERIQAGEQPPLDWQHESTARMVARRMPETSGEVYADEDLAKLWCKIEKLGERLKTLGEARDRLKALAHDRFGTRGVIDLADGKWLVRRLVERSPYTVRPKPYVEIRKVNAKGANDVDGKTKGSR